MAKKKKKIVHIYYELSDPMLCGLIKSRYDTHVDNINKWITKDGDFRLCHKCKHIHKIRAERSRSEV